MKLLDATFVGNKEVDYMVLDDGRPTKAFVSIINLKVEFHFEIMEVPTLWIIEPWKVEGRLWELDENFHFPYLDELQDFQNEINDIRNGLCRPQIILIDLTLAIRTAKSTEDAVELLRTALLRHKVIDKSMRIIRRALKKGEDHYYQTHPRPVIMDPEYPDIPLGHDDDDDNDD